MPGGSWSISHAALYPFPFVKNLLGDKLSAGNLWDCLRRGLMNARVCSSPTAWAHPNAGAHGPSLPSFSTPSPFWLLSRPVLCQAISALLTGNKTNLTIKSKCSLFLCSFFPPWDVCWNASVEGGWSAVAAGKAEQECTGGNVTVTALAWVPSRGEAILEGAEKGSLLQQP